MDVIDEQRNMEKYFPAVDRDAMFCIGCASFGHRFAACPLRNCRLCGSIAGDHTLFGCSAVHLSVPPQSEKPESEFKPGRGKGKDKAKRKGQVPAVADTGTAAPAPAQPSKCPYCLEDCIHTFVCPLLWRTFVRDPASNRSADKISTACYVCGLDDHFGGDCKKNTSEHISGRRFSRDDDIWSRKYALLFSDLTKMSPSTRLQVPNNGIASAAVISLNQEAKRIKTGQGEKNSYSRPAQASLAAQAVESDITGSGGNIQGTVNKQQIPSSSRAQAAANMTCEQASTKSRTRKRRKVNGQVQSALINTTLSNCSAVPALGTATTTAANTKFKAQGIQQTKTKEAHVQGFRESQPVAASAATVVQPLPQVQVKGAGQGQGQIQTPTSAPNKKSSARRQRRCRASKKARAAAEVANGAGEQGSKQTSSMGNAQAGFRARRSRQRNKAASLA
ncbi:hypothetical protein SEPCBS57363_006614 [Sporothrix epigloea]|uniref:CCHC-type domain-containing protein n=1 Tax=Sporothrix epigloea TaxID=1892477 RepID=A0ABP0E5W3_9PEZI